MNKITLLLPKKISSLINCVRLIALMSIITLNLQHAHAMQSLRRCLVLPIIDNFGGAVGHTLFQDLEQYLRTGSWCNYQSNSELLSILGQYSKNLKEHLNNKDVLKIIAERMQVGTLIKVEMESQVGGIDLYMKVLGENGEDIYFSEKIFIDKKDISSSYRVVKSWLDQYEKTIPYDGLITGIVGKEITIAIDKSPYLQMGEKIFVRRPLVKKQHPLLKEVVAWETELLAIGEIYNVSQKQALAVIGDFVSDQKPMVGDWVRVDRKSHTESDIHKSYPKLEGYEFGKLGFVNFSILLGKSEMSTTYTGSLKKMGGQVIGLSAAGEIWATRNFWSGLEISKSMSTYKKKSGKTAIDSVSESTGFYSFKLGYKYLPLGFFYGPQVDGYVGLAKFSYDIDIETSEGFGLYSFKGTLLGARGNIPVLKKLRATFEMEFLLFPKFEDDNNYFGNSDSVSSYQLELGGLYDLNIQLQLNSSIVITSNKAKFKAPYREIHFKELELKTGISFIF